MNEVFQRFSPQVIELIGLDQENLHDNFLAAIKRDAIEKCSQWAGTVGGERLEDRPLSILNGLISVIKVTADDFPQALMKHWGETSEVIFPDVGLRNLAAQAIKVFLEAYGSEAVKMGRLEVAASALDVVTKGGFTQNPKFVAKVKKMTNDAEQKGDVLKIVELAELVQRGISSKQATSSSQD